MIDTGIMDDANTNSSENIVTNDEHKKIARELNEEGIILLKYDSQTLPLDINKDQKLLILGEDDLAINPMTHGTGSGAVHSSSV